MTFTLDGVQFGSVTLRWFGLFLITAVLVSTGLAGRLAKEAGLPRGVVWRALAWIVPGALLGARAWYVVFPPQSAVLIGRDAGWQITHFFDLNQGAVAVWAGGLGFLGALLGGAFMLWRFAHYLKQPAARWFDLAAPALALGQSIGYWGIGANGDLPRLWAWESALGAAVFVALMILRRRIAPTPDGKDSGRIAALYLILYGGGRFILEFFRDNVSLISGVNISQAMCALFALSGAWWWYRLSRSLPPPESPPSAVHSDR
ncbi:MAG TPA: prolipoprotein diacylglyceryl transferase [Aggregatilineales bacterium]|nr:prolipoprotein diacylglyceryl transferase [Anaerolineales bacterium]HRE48537.1 prolipoprotein diacylglyceryl transferase [Aggregatilineales bacterium]